MGIASIISHSGSTGLRMARKLGVSMKIAAPGASTWTTVYGFILDSQKDTSEGDQEVLTVNIPIQTGIPPTSGWETGHVLQYRSINYKIDSVTPDYGTEPEASSFTLSCSRYVAGDCDVGAVPA